MSPWLSSMKRHNPAAFANPDPVQCPVQRIQGVKEGFRLDLSTISPKAFSHSVQGLDGVLNFMSSSRRCYFTFRLFLRHSVTLLQDIALSFNC
ncbi:hypothetical protein ABH912_000019 [Pseudomonas sp. BT76 TE3572]